MQLWEKLILVIICAALSATAVVVVAGVASCVVLGIWLLYTILGQYHFFATMLSLVFVWLGLTCWLYSQARPDWRDPLPPKRPQSALLRRAA